MRARRPAMVRAQLAATPTQACCPAMARAQLSVAPTPGSGRQAPPHPLPLAGYLRRTRWRRARVALRQPPPLPFFRRTRWHIACVDLPPHALPPVRWRWASPLPSLRQGLRQISYASRCHVTPPLSVCDLRSPTGDAPSPPWISWQGTPQLPPPPMGSGLGRPLPPVSASLCFAALLAATSPCSYVKEEEGRRKNKDDERPRLSLCTKIYLGA